MLTAPERFEAAVPDAEVLRSNRRLVPARPSRWQLSGALLWLLVDEPRALMPEHLVSLFKIAFISVAVGLGLGQYCSQGVPVLLSFVCGFLGLLGAIAAISAGLFALTQLVCDLDQHERYRGAFFGIRAEDLSVSVPGATMVCRWEEVAIHESPFGLLFRLPWRAFHLLPHGTLHSAEMRGLSPVLERAKWIRAIAQLAPGSRA